MHHYADQFELKFGKVTVAVDGDGVLVWLYTSTDDKSVQVEEYLRKNFGAFKWNHNKCAHVVRQLSEYNDRKRKSFNLEYRTSGTAFQKMVWDELTRIPYGTAISYSELASRIGNPKAPRAVGQANRKNPIMIVIPCHRVICADGKIVGSDSRDVRRLLLDHENVKY